MLGGRTSAPADSQARLPSTEPLRLEAGEEGRVRVQRQACLRVAERVHYDCVKTVGILSLGVARIGQVTAGVGTGGETHGVQEVENRYRKSNEDGGPQAARGEARTSSARRLAARS